MSATGTFAFVIRLALGGKVRIMTNIPNDRRPLQGRKGDYSFDYVTFGLLAIGVIWAIVEIALRYV
jgi:hypothetical protein